MYRYSNLIKYFVAVVLSIIISGSSYAKEGDSIFFIGQIGVAVGGDQLAEFTYSDGTTESIDGGDGSNINAGFLIKPFDHKNLETQVTVGLIEEKMEASNGTVTWTRNNLDFIQFYRFDSFRIGAGVTYHFNLNIKGTGIASSIDSDADDTLGFVSEIDWFLGKREICEVFLGIKFTSIDYDFSGQTFSGNSIGALFGIYF